MVAPLGLARCHGVQGTPGGVGVTTSSSCPGGLCTGAGRAAPAAKSLPGQPGGCPGRLGAGGGGGLRPPLGRAVGRSVSGVGWGGRRSCSLPSPVGVCGVHRGPGATGRNRFGRPGEALSRSAGVEPGMADAGCRRPTQPPGIGGGLGAGGRSRVPVPACVRCPAVLCGVTSGQGVSPAGGHGWVWGTTGGFAPQGAGTCPGRVAWQRSPRPPVGQEGVAGCLHPGVMPSVGQGWCLALC